MPAVCPDQHLLELLVLGKVSEDEAEHLEAHVGTCACCLQHLSALQTVDPLVTAFREASQMETAPEAGLIEAVIPCLKRLRPKEVTEPFVPRMQDRGEAAPPATLASYDFLAPAERPGELGRLGPYRLLQLLGSGGMGLVFLVEDPRLQRQLALKVIRPDLVARAELRERFLVEARAVAAVEHDNIVTVYEVNEEAGVPFLAMPLLRGQTLEEQLQASNGPLPVDDILRIGRQTADGLAAAHARGLIHRDIKPGNLFLAVGQAFQPDSGQAVRLESLTYEVKILDFGLAQVSSAEGSDRKREGTIAGTPSYMAPEQAQGKPVDARADLFSLGCVLYRLCAGQPPFPSTDTMATFVAVATEQPPPLASLNPEVPPALADLVMKLLAKQPDDRPASAQEVAATLRQIEEDRRPKPSRRRWLLLSAACVLVAAGLTAALVAHFRPPLVPEEPGTITFLYAQPDQRLALRRGEEEERVIDLQESPTVLLPAGDYVLRPLAAVGERRLFPDRVLVKAGQKQRIRLQLVGEARRHRAHDLPVRGLAVCARQDELLVVSVSEDRTLAAWDPARLDKPKVVWHRDSPLRCVAIAAEGRLAATGSGDVGPRAVQVIRLWDLDKLKPGPVDLTCRSQVNAVVFSPNGQWLLSAENDGTLVLWDVRAAAVEWEEAKTHGGLGTFALAFSPDGKQILSGGGDAQVVLRDAAAGRVLRTLEGHAKTVRAVAFLPDGTAGVSAGLDTTIRIWDLASPKARVLMAPAPIHALAVSPDGKRLLTGDAGGAVRLWDLAEDKEIIAFAGHARGVTAVALTPDGRRAFSGGSDGTVRSWDLPD